MDPIKPLKVIKIDKGSSSSPIPIDTSQKRADYDARLLDNSPLAEQYRHYPLMQFFDLSLDERMDDSINKKLKDVYTWVSYRYPNSDNITTTRALRMLENEIGMPELGDTRLNNIWSYAFLDNQINDLNNQKREKYGY